MRSLLAVALLLDLFLLVPAGSADTPPPASGDWTITDMTFVSARSIDLHGNLSIKNGGTLELRNCTLLMNCNVDDQYAIKVERGGQLNMYYSRVDTADFRFKYRFILDGNAQIRDCAIDLDGYYESGGKGIEINSDYVSLLNSSISSSCIALSINNSSPLISGCYVHGLEYGIYCFGDSSPLIEYNDIEFTNNAGIYNEGVSSAFIRNNTFKEITIDIFNAGWSHADIIGNDLRSSGNVGILNTEHSSPYIEKNMLLSSGIPYGTTDIGIANFESSDPDIIDNQIIFREFGICNWGNSTPSIKDNHISKVDFGIRSNDSSAPEIIHNNITDCMYTGILSYGNSTPTLTENTIANCTANAILNGENSRPEKINDNIITNITAGSAVLNTDSAKARIYNNTIKLAGLHGIDNSMEANLTIENNSIYNCSANGVDNRGNVTVEMVGNTIAGNGMAGIDGYENSSLKMIRNRISGNGVRAIGCYDNSRVNLTENNLTNNPNGIEISSSEVELSRTDISTGKYGVKIFNASPVIADINITGMMFGIQLSRANALISTARISSVEKYSVYCSDSSSPLVANSTISQTKNGWDVYVSGGSLLTTLNTTFDQALAKVEDTSALRIKWFMEMHVVDSKWRPLDRANVSFGGTDDLMATTDMNGTIFRLPLDDKVMKKGSVTKAIHTASIEKNGYNDSYENIMINRSEKQTFIFDFSPVIGSIPEQFIDEDVHCDLDLSRYITDCDNDATGLKVKLRGGSENDHNVSVNGTVLHMYYPLPGDDTVLFNVSDGIKNASSKISIHVNPVNDAPVIQDIPTIELYEHTPYIMDISPYISDEEDTLDKLTVTVDSLYATSLGHNVAFHYPEGMRGDAVNIIVSDSEGAPSFSTINITVIPVNDPPIITVPFNITPVEDVEYIVDLSKQCFDPDSPIQDIRVSTNSSYCRVTGLTLRFKYPEGVTREYVQVNISDGCNWTLYDILVNVTPVDDPPKLTFPEITVLAGTTQKQDLWDFLSDPDTPKERLVLSTTSRYATIRGFNITFRYPADMASGFDIVQLSLTDGTTTTNMDMPVNVTAQKTTIRLSEQYALYLYFAIPLTVFGTVAGILAYRRVKYGWYEIKRALLVNDDGRMLAHTGEKSEGDDEMLVSSMLTAVQQFIEEAMKKEKAGSIKEFQYEDMKIAVERGEKLFLAVFLNGYTTDGLRKDMKQIVNAIEGKFKDDLAAWDGRITRSDFIDAAQVQLKGLMEKKGSKQNQQ